jgi:hypothetical protein
MMVPSLKVSPAVLVAFHQKAILGKAAGWRDFDPNLIAEHWSHPVEPIPILLEELAGGNKALIAWLQDNYNSWWQICQELSLKRLRPSFFALYDSDTEAPCFLQGLSAFEESQLENLPRFLSLTPSSAGMEGIVGTPPISSSSQTRGNDDLDATSEVGGMDPSIQSRGNDDLDATSEVGGMEESRGNAFAAQFTGGSLHTKWKRNKQGKKLGPYFEWRAFGKTVYLGKDPWKPEALDKFKHYPWGKIAVAKLRKLNSTLTVAAAQGQSFEELAALLEEG